MQIKKAAGASGQLPETLKQVYARLGRESVAAYRASPFSILSRNYFSRFSRDPRAQPAATEVVINSRWIIELARSAQPLTRVMAGELVEFLGERMALRLPIKEESSARKGQGTKVISLLDHDGGDPQVPESFTIAVTPGRVQIRGRDAAGLRDGVVRLVNLMGLRQAPFLEIREQIYRPRLGVRIGTLPWQGSCRDLLFFGYNALLLSGGGFHEISRSDAIPELKRRRDPHILQKLKAAAREAVQYGLKTYFWTDTRNKFPKDDPVFVAHPDLRGPVTHKADGDYILCTEHPLVQRYYTETVAGVFRDIPGLWGLGVIIGGEGFYHCFMHPHGAPGGHTTCPRCEALGPDVVVSKLCNRLARAARSINPAAQVVAWPYSAEHVWAMNGAMSRTIARLEPGVGLLTEIEKEALVEKPDGVSMLAWDYSIDVIGPCERAKQQIGECRAHGIPVYMKSEPELAFEASRLSHVPCLDRWFERAEALAACGASGAMVVPAFRNFYGSSTAESNLWMWWDPCRNKEWILDRLADRLAGAQAGPALRRAWRLVSEAIAWSPNIPAYYNGPHYLGPAHPMCADPDRKMPAVFYGQYLFRAEITDEEGLRKRPTFWTNVANGPVMLKFYRRMEELLGAAVSEINRTEAQVPPRCRLPYRAETSAIRWFYHTARTEANFYEACILRDRLRDWLARPAKSRAVAGEARALYRRWRQVLLAEQRNAREALPVAKADMRLDWYYGGDHTFPHHLAMLRAKLKLIREEREVFLPSVARKI